LVVLIRTEARFRTLAALVSSLPPQAGLLIRFSTCRAIFIEAKSGGAGGYLAVELSDAPGQVAAAGNLKGDQLLPLSCTAIISGDVTGVFILY
jgi:hypothetical protein